MLLPGNIATCMGFGLNDRPGKNKRSLSEQYIHHNVLTTAGVRFASPKFIKARKQDETEFVTV